MVFANIGLEKMLKRIKFKEAIAYDYIVPIEYSGCPKLEEWIPPFEYKEIPEEEDLPKNSDLWKQFMNKQYSKATPESLRGIINRKKAYGFSMHTSGLICLALENAFYHGNQNNPELPVTLKAFQGKKGLVIRIRDSGIGFDYKEKIKLVKNCLKKYLQGYGLEQSKKENKYFTRAGTGFLYFASAETKFSFDNKGTVINIMYKF